MEAGNGHGKPKWAPAEQPAWTTCLPRTARRPLAGGLRSATGVAKQQVGVLLDGPGQDAGPDGLPILDECGRWFAGRIVEQRALGDHVAFVLEPFAASDDGSTATLAFHRAKQLTPGHEA